jgi:hypothetical protein
LLAADTGAAGDMQLLARPYNFVIRAIRVAGFSLGTLLAFGGAFRALIRQIGWLFAGTKLNKWQN